MLQLHTFNTRSSYSGLAVKAKSSPLHFGRDSVPPEPGIDPSATGGMGDDFKSQGRRPLEKKDFLPFEKALRKLPEFKASEIDLHRSYEKFFSTSTKKHVQEIMSQITPNDVKELHPKAVLISKTGNMLFEFYKLTALRSGLITDEDVDKWKREFAQWQKPDEEKPVYFFLQKIISDLESKDLKRIAAFQKLVEEDKPERAKWLLGLIGLHFTFLASEDNKFSVPNDVKPFVQRRANELIDHFPQYSFSKLKSWLFSKAYLDFNIPMLPRSAFKNQMMKLAQENLGVPIPYEGVMGLTYDTQWRSRRLDFEWNEELPKTGQRASVIRSLEALEEVALYKRTHKQSKR